MCPPEFPACITCGHQSHVKLWLFRVFAVESAGKICLWKILQKHLKTVFCVWDTWCPSCLCFVIWCMPQRAVSVLSCSLYWATAVMPVFSTDNTSACVCMCAYRYMFSLMSLLLPIYLFLSACSCSWQISERWWRGCWALTLPAWLFLTMKSSHALMGWFTPISTTSVSPVSASKMWQGPQRSSKETSSFFTERRWNKVKFSVCFLTCWISTENRSLFLFLTLETPARADF